MTQKEAQMKRNSLLLIFCVLCFASLQAILAPYAQAQTAAGGPEKIKAILLRPAGWIAYWSGPFGDGESEFIFMARKEKVVVKIQTPSVSSCESEVTITSDTVKFDGCRDPDITLVFDPNDHDYPFKGKSPRLYVYKLKAK